MKRQSFHVGAVACLIGLIMLCLCWELWLAPLRPGGSFLVFKAVLLLLPLRGVLKGKVYTYQWLSMFSLAYFTEGVMRAWGDGGMVRVLALLEIALSAGLFVCVTGFAHSFKRQKPSVAR